MITALSEMSINSGIGVKIEKPKKLINLVAFLFGEDQGRYIIEVNIRNLTNVEKILKSNNVHFENIGLTQKNIEIQGIEIS